MLKNLLAIISVPLVAVHLFILYLWIFDWEKLVTQIGLMSWAGSILLGIVVYLAYRKLVSAGKTIMVGKRIIFSSTLITIVLGILALIIESITSSMP